MSKWSIAGLILCVVGWGFHFQGEYGLAVLTQLTSVACTIKGRLG